MKILAEESCRVCGKPATNVGLVDVEDEPEHWIDGKRYQCGHIETGSTNFGCDEHPAEMMRKLLDGSLFHVPPLSWDERPRV